MEEKDKHTPTRSSNREKEEGGRWTSDPDTVEVADRYSEGVGGMDENSGGISNRPLAEEVERQRDLPDRGSSRAEESGEGDAERMTDDDRDVVARVDRGQGDTPRRYEEEADDVMPSDG